MLQREAISSTPAAFFSHVLSIPFECMYSSFPRLNAKKRKRMNFQSTRRRGEDGVATVINFLLSNARLVLGVGGAAILGIATLAVKRVGGTPQFVPPRHLKNWDGYSLPLFHYFCHVQTDWWGALERWTCGRRSEGNEMHARLKQTANSQ